MKKQLMLILAALVVSFSHNAMAAFDKAMQAYDSGKFEQSYKMFLVLAEQGNEDAQFNLGLMYLDGLGVQKDLIKAYAWIKLSDERNSYETDLLSDIKKDIGDADAASVDKYYQELKRKLP